jgi:hypothetical protein
MRNLSLIALRSRNDETNLWSNRDGKMTEASLVGSVLARRYKILEAVDVDSFKAHDLALDQTVTVRRALLASQRAGETWRQKVQQLALMRDPGFLNILDVIVEKSGAFVITERSRGRSIADLLRESSRLDLEDVLRLMTALAGALDLAADLGFFPHPISSRWLFTETRNSVSVDRQQRSFSDWPFLIKLDVWELVRPRDNSWPIITSKVQRRGSRALAVRRAALFTYELLGGEKKKEGAVRRWFKPISGLGNAGNSILYRGLQASPLFESSECFLHKLKSAIRSRGEELRTLPAPALASRVYTVTLPGASETIRRFNRDTRWLATGVLGVLVCTVLVLAVLVQERKPKADDLTVVDPNSYDGFTVTGLNRKSSGDKTTSGQARSVDQASTEISPKEKPSPQIEAAASTPTPVLGFTPEINHIKAGLNTFSWTPVVRQGSARVIGPRTHNVKNKSSVGFGTVDVKRRLIELWHQSLAHSERSRSWTAFSNLSRGASKKTAYTDETSH